MKLKHAHVVALTDCALGCVGGFKKGQTVLVRGANTASVFFLEENGLIEMEESEGKVKFRLTDAGRAALEEARK